MKKLFFTIYALAVVFAVGCSKEEFVNPASEYKLVVNMDKASFSDATRAPRNSWLEGDEVMLFFGADYQSEKWLTLLYKDNVWSIKDRADFDERAYITELANTEAKTLVAVYCSTPGDVALDDYGYMLCLSEPKELGMLVMTCDDGSYSVDNEQGIFTINASLSPGDENNSFVQFTLRGIDLKSWNDKDWMLKLNRSAHVYSCLDFMFFADEDEDFAIVGVDTDNVADVPLMGYKYDDDGVSFFAVVDNGYFGQENDFEFGLTDRQCYYTKTFTGKTLQPNSAIIFDGPKNDAEIGGTTSNGWKRTR
jgi:hypothetical protein